MKYLCIRPLCLCVLFLILILPPAVCGQSPDDYPLPEGPPDEWKTPGRSETLVPAEEPSTTMTPMGTRPGEQAPNARNRPNAPSGEAYEKYTGTRPFGGGVAGTGITPFGTVQR